MRKAKGATRRECLAGWEARHERKQGLTVKRSRQSSEEVLALRRGKEGPCSMTSRSQAIAMACWETAAGCRRRGGEKI